MPKVKSIRIIRICESCKRSFDILPSAAKRGCGRFCSRHCQTVLTMERLLKLTRPGPNGCILWAGGVDKDGYGKICVNMRHSRAHRASWEIIHGAIPDGLSVLHRCDNPPCVNVEHLFLGTIKENNEDRTAKGRQAKGQKNGGGVKLSDAKVLEIRRRYAAGDITQQSLADEYGVTQGLIGFIVRRESWKHL